METKMRISDADQKSVIVAVCVFTAGWLVFAASAEAQQSKKSQKKRTAVSKVVKPEAKRSSLLIKQTFYPALTPFEQKFQSKLNEKVEFNFVETPLEEVIKNFQEFSGVSFVVLKDHLANEGIALDQSITVPIPEISLKSALALVLNPLGLTYVIERDYVKITSKYAAEELLKTRVYPVGDYCQTPEDYDTLEQAIKNASLGKWSPWKNPFDASSDTSTGTGRGLFKVPSGRGKGSSGGLEADTVDGDNGDLPGQHGSDKGKENTLSLIIGGGQRVHIQENTEGTISIVMQSKSLVISQTNQIHEKIVELLTQLRQARADQE
ncbi:MAG: hypothetical protein P1V19_10215 [Gimesia sp.]|nr:hypothetical protein [Gimesia sp.]